MKSRGKVLVTDYVHDELLTGLTSLGYEVIYDKDYNPGSLEKDLPSLEGIIINSKIKMTAERQALAKKLKFIGRLGSGLEIIDLQAASKNHISVFNSPEGNRNAVAEHALGMLLCLANNIIVGDAEVRNRIWSREKNRGIELEGKTVGIIGFGNTGQAFARKLSGWTLDITYYDPYLLNVPDDLNYITSESIDQLIALSDIISLHAPLTNETKHMVDARFLKACKPGTILINTSRGAVVKTIDLVKALQENLISGACLDVFENEKPHCFSKEESQLYNELYSMENVILTPHVAGWTDDSLLRIAKVLLKKIASFNTT